MTVEELEENKLTVEDGVYILDMIIPLSDEKFTCRHLLPNGDCGDYENRPRMCSNYPYGRACGYEECTMKGLANAPS